jgi:hypothetical protein
MKHYSISLTITDLDDNKQLISVQAPQLTGQQIFELTTLALAGVLIEPDPPVLTTTKPEKPRPVRKHKIRNLLARKDSDVPEIPPNFDPKDVE